MSFIRAASCLRSSSARVWPTSRRFASTSASSGGSSTLPTVLLTSGAVLAGAYWWMQTNEPKQVKSPLDPQNFIDFKLKKIIPYNHNTSTFVFEIPKKEASLLPVASCVVFKDPNLVDKDGKPVIRPYTPISPSDKKGELTFMIKKYDTGVMSKHVHELKEGDTIGIKGPIPKFEYKINQFDEVTLIGGGSGITPLYQILGHALADKTNKTKFTFIFSNVTEQDILMKETLDALQKKYPQNLNMIYTLDKPQGSWTGHTGYVTKDFLKSTIAPASLADKTKVFVCGPPGQVAAIAGKKAGMKQGELGGILKELGYAEDQVFKF